MLKNKKALYVLFPLTILIWGLVSYKIYIGLKGDDDMGVEINAVPTLLVPDSGIDTFSVFNNYRDPFLGAVKKPRMNNGLDKNASKPNVSNNNVIKPPLPPVNGNWPTIQYSGILKNQSNSTSLILLSINGKTYTLKQGDAAEGIKVISFSNAEVILQRGKEKRNFLK